jgi:molecular chaperone GrpE
VERTPTDATAETPRDTSADAPRDAADTAREGASAADERSKYLYALAEAENARKRLERRAEETLRALKRRLLLAFLPVLDNLERALAYGGSKDLREGLAATLRGFEEALEREGVTPLESTAGRRFDPSVAEAVGTERGGEDVPDETVLSEERRGYRVDGELLRPAHVIVSKSG